MNSKDTAVEISKVEIKMGDTTVALTVNQAKELKRLLNDTFPDPSYVVRERPYWYRDYNDYGVIPWAKPIVTWDATYDDADNTVYCSLNA